ncbi:transposase [Micromonospora echinaurantiaca]|uniref:transposase n=1 Tax=Micromonospora echinaurantiaca TaxID=47857 RepID=UPI000B5AD9D1
MQRLLYRAVWDADAVRDDLRQLIVDRFGGLDAVLAVGETGDLKKGTHTVGVQRPSTAAGPRARPPSPNSPASPGSAGPSKRASKPPKARSAWTSTRSAAGTPGTGSPPSPWLPSPSWRSASRRGPPRPCRHRTDQTHGQRSPSPDQRLHHPPDQQPRPSSALVTMAAPGSSPSPTIPPHTPPQPRASAMIPNGGCRTSTI